MIVVVVIQSCAIFKMPFSRSRWWLRPDQEKGQRTGTQAMTNVTKRNYGAVKIPNFVSSLSRISLVIGKKPPFSVWS